MVFNEYFTREDIAKELNLTEMAVEGLCDEYEVFLRRVNEDGNTKYHPSSIGMIRHILELASSGKEKREIIASLGFNASFLCAKDKSFCKF